MVKKNGKHFNELDIHLFMAADVTPSGVLRQEIDVTRRLFAPFGELVMVEEVSLWLEKVK